MTKKKHTGLWQYPVPRPLAEARSRVAIEALDKIADIVLAYKPTARSKPAIQRKRRATKIAKASR